MKSEGEKAAVFDINPIAVLVKAPAPLIGQSPGSTYWVEPGLFSLEAALLS